MSGRDRPSWPILFHAVVNGEVRRPFAIAPNETRRRTRKPRAKAVRAEARLSPHAVVDHNQVGRHTVPIVMAITGLVATLNRPGGNVTGVSFFTTTLEPKRLELLQEVTPNVAVIATLLNPKSLDYDNQVREVQAAARSIGQQIVVLNASSERDIETAFATVVQQRVGAILVGSDPFFTDRRNQLVALAAHHGIPAIYQWREFAEAGGLMSYGTSLTDAYRSVGVYASRIFKGTKSATFRFSNPLKSSWSSTLKLPGRSGLPFRCRFRAAPMR